MSTRQKITQILKTLVISIVLLCTFATNADAAERYYLNDDYNYYNSRLTMQRYSSVDKEQLAQQLGLSTGETVELRKYYIGVNGDIIIRYRQMYLGIPVIGGDIIISRRNNNVYKRGHGTILKGIANDLADVIPEITENEAMQIAKDLSAAGVSGTILYENEKSQLAIWQDENNTAQLVYEVSFLQDAETSSRPHYIIDADTGAVLDYFDNLQTAQATGPGGNLKTGQYYYGTDFDYLDVWQSGDTCSLVNNHVKTIDLKNSGVHIGDHPAFSFTCPENNYKVTNGAYSPLNDAHYFGGVAYKMYRDWIFTDPLTFQLVLKVHFGNGLANAWWMGGYMIFGDGNTEKYPYVTLGLAPF